MAFDVGQPAYLAFRSIVAERTRPLMAWVGSGLSAAAGLPTWPGLKKHLVEALRGKASTLDEPDASRLYRAANAIEAQPDYWTAFQMLRNNLGPTSYRDGIREAFQPAVKADVPQTYRSLWRLRLNGILNLNLDRLATRAFTEEHPGELPGEFSGPQAARLPQTLGTHRFIANLHGIAEDYTTWVLTREELNRLLGDEAYISFLRNALSSYTILFVGMSVDDVAVGGHLKALTDLGIQASSHFWLTSRTDYATDQWAEEIGVRVIRYRAIGGDHSEVMEFFRDISSYVPDDTSPAPPVALDRYEPDEALPEPAELASWDAERIRQLLNSYAAKILEAGTDEAYEKYSEFSRKYDEAIYRAWYTSTAPGRNHLLDYELHEEIARGAFGRVFRADGPNGEHVAVKVLLEEIRNQRDQLQSFRRGVRSMRILFDRGVEGMVAYLEASEIPAFVAMQFIEGPNLNVAKQAGYVDDWSTILRISCELADIIRNAHSLPERVLHRDLRPSNIMLKDLYSSPDDWKVVVLDFDLSWHRGALEQSILPLTAGTGYLAPEQIQPIRGVTTRSAAVDSFGLGMTLLFMCSGRDPLPSEHMYRDWETIVRRETARLPKSAWVSLPERFARIIVAATRNRQFERWDFAQISQELERLRLADLEPDAVNSAELLVEEVAARSDVMTRYRWNDDAAQAEIVLPTGMEVRLQADEPRAVVTLTLQWSSTGVEERRNLGRYVSRGARGAIGQLRKAGWNISGESIESQSVHIKATMSVSRLRGRAAEVAQGLDGAVEGLRFSQ